MISSRVARCVVIRGGSIIYLRYRMHGSCKNFGSASFGSARFGGDGPRGELAQAGAGNAAGRRQAKRGHPLYAAQECW